MTTPNCPDRRRLAEFTAGKLDEPSSEQIAVHLEACADCQSTMVNLASDQDTVGAALRKVSQSPAQPAGAAVRKALHSAAQMIPSPPTGKVTPSAAASGGPVVTLTLEQFAHSLSETGVVDGDNLTAIRGRLSNEQREDPQALARELIAAGHLTKFQALNALQGKAKGLVFGEHVVLDRIGAGGMGQVFKAKHRRMDRLVALKVMSPAAVKNADSVRRFEREVRAAAKLMHPNIVTAHDAGVQDGVHFLVMEYVEGPDLSSLLKKQGKLPIKQACDYIAQAARGFAYAHSKGIVHRDIKPGNLLVDKDGTVKVLDMGLARFDDGGVGGVMSEGELTQSGAVMGTVDYMAPEQAMNTRNADAKSDVYGLGCSLYRLLTGESVYGGQTMVEKIMAHREKPIPVLRAVRPDAPPALETLVTRMLAKESSQRPSMQETAETLANIDAMPTITTAAPGKSGIGIGAPPIAPTAAAPAIAMGVAAPQAGRPSPAAKPKTQGAAPPRKRSNTPLLAAAGAGAVLIALGVWFIFRDKDGNETARVQLPEGGKVETTVDPGPQKLTPPVAAASPTTQVASNDATKMFTLPTTNAPTTATENSAVERAAAQKVLQLGGVVSIVTAEKPTSSQVRSVTDLPSGPFSVNTLDWTRTNASDADLAVLPGLTKIATLRLPGTRVTDAGLVHLYGLTSLKTLNLIGAPVTDAGVAALQARLPDCVITATSSSTQPAPAVVTNPPPIASAAGGDLYVYPESMNAAAPCITVPSLMFDGKSTWLFEAWCVAPPAATAAPWAAAQGGQATGGFFGFNLTDEPMIRATWSYPSKEPEHYRLFHYFQIQKDGQAMNHTIGIGDAVPPGLHHVAVQVAPLRQGSWTVTTSMDGKRGTQQAVPLRFGSTMRFQSHGYISEMRISKQRGYSTPYTPEARWETDERTVALYHCDEGSGTQLIDSSGNGHHGIITDGRWSPVGSPPGTPVAAFTPMVNVPAPVAPLTPPTSSTALPLVEVLTGDKLTGVADGVLTFYSPDITGRRKGRGMVVSAPANWQTEGTVFTCTFANRNGSGIQFVHPFKNGHVRVHLMTEAKPALFNDGAWNIANPAKPHLEDSAYPFNLVRNKFPLGERSYPMVSKLDASGRYELWVDYVLTLTAQFDSAEPLRMKPPFVDKAAPDVLTPGQAAVIANGPGSGHNEARDVFLTTMRNQVLPSLPVVNAPAPQETDPERRAIEWARARIAKLALAGPLGAGVTLPSGGGLPNEPFTVRIIDFQEVQSEFRRTIGDADMPYLAGLKGIENLRLPYTQLTDAGMAPIATLTSLISLDLNEARISDAGIRTLAPLVKLRHLNLNGSNITDAGVALIAAQFPSLNETLNLNYTQVTDEGIQQLGQMKHLRGLSLNGTRVTMAGIERLKAVKPNLGITWSPDAPPHVPSQFAGDLRVPLHASVISLPTAIGGLRPTSAPVAPPSNANIPAPQPLPDDPAAERQAAAAIIGREGAVQLRFNNAVTPVIKDVASLPAGPFQIEVVTWYGKKHVNDADLKLVARLPKLRILNLYDTSVTDEGLAALHDLVGLDDINLSYLKGDGRGLVHLSKLPNLRKLIVPASSTLTDAGLAASLPLIKDLVVLDLNRTAISGIDFVRGMTRLENLNLGNTRVADLAPLAIQTSLRTLILSNAPLDDADAAALRNCTQLESIRFDGTNLTDAGLVHLEGLKALKQLPLEGTYVTAAGAARLQAKLPSCEIKVNPRTGTPPPAVLATPPTITTQVATTPVGQSGQITILSVHHVRTMRADELIVASSVPAVLQGRTAVLTHAKGKPPEANGYLQFRVEQDGPLYLAANWEFDGGLAGAWARQLVTEPTLIGQGWKKIGDVKCRMHGPKPGAQVDADYALFVRDCKVGETFGIRTKKNSSPRLFVTAPGPGLAFETPSEGPGTAPISDTPLAVPVGPTATAVVAAPASRQSVPEMKDQAATLAIIKDVYKDDYLAARVPDKKSPFATKLLQQATTVSDPIERYVLLSEARVQAVDGDDPLVLQNILAALVAGFEVDPAMTWIDGWKAMLAKSRPVPLARTIYDAADKQFDAAVVAADFEPAKKFADFLATTAPRLSDAAVTKTARDRQTALTARQQEYVAAKAAVEKLATAADDAAANSVVGRYRATVENDWPNAFPLLAKGNEEPWKELAAKSLSAAADGPSRAAVGDAWWDAAQAKPTQKAELTAAALYWYQGAVGSLNGLNKTRVEKRIADAAAIVRPRTIPPTMLAGEVATLRDGDTALKGDMPKLFELGGPTIPTPGASPNVATAPQSATLADPAFQQWITTTAALPAERQVDMVMKKMIELNPGNPPFGGNHTPTISDGRVVGLAFDTVHVADISPVRALGGLTTLNCSCRDRSKLSDLSPLRGLALTTLICTNTAVRDLSPLRGMPLTRLVCNGTRVSDLSPLLDCKQLRELRIPAHVPPEQIEALKRALPNCAVSN